MRFVFFFSNSPSSSSPPCFFLLCSHHVASPLTGLPPLRIRATPSATEFFSATQRTRRGGIVFLQESTSKVRIERKFQASRLSSILSLASSAPPQCAEASTGSRGGIALECERNGRREKRTARGRRQAKPKGTERENSGTEERRSGRAETIHLLSLLLPASLFLSSLSSLARLYACFFPFRLRTRIETKAKLAAALTEKRSSA